MVASSLQKVVVSDGQHLVRPSLNVHTLRYATSDIKTQQRGKSSFRTLIDFGHFEKIRRAFPDVSLSETCFILYRDWKFPEEKISVNPLRILSFLQILNPKILN